jgi:hypothetical protein
MPLERESQSDTAAKPESMSETDPTSEHSSRTLQIRIPTSADDLHSDTCATPAVTAAIGIRHVDVLAFNKPLAMASFSLSFFFCRCGHRGGNDISND